MIKNIITKFVFIAFMLLISNNTYAKPETYYKLSEPKVIDNVPLKTKYIAELQLATNPSQRSTNEIIFDKNGDMYLSDSDSGLIWKRYKNGEWELLDTERHIKLITIGDEIFIHKFRQDGHGSGYDGFDPTIRRIKDIYNDDEEYEENYEKNDVLNLMKIPEQYNRGFYDQYYPRLMQHKEWTKDEVIMCSFEWEKDRVYTNFKELTQPFEPTGSDTRLFFNTPFSHAYAINKKLKHREIDVSICNDVHVNEYNKKFTDKELEQGFGLIPGQLIPKRMIDNHKYNIVPKVIKDDTFWTKIYQKTKIKGSIRIETHKLIGIDLKTNKVIKNKKQHIIDLVDAEEYGIMIFYELGKIKLYNTTTGKSKRVYLNNALKYLRDPVSNKFYIGEEKTSGTENITFKFKDNKLYWFVKKHPNDSMHSYIMVSDLTKYTKDSKSKKMRFKNNLKIN